MYLLYLFDTVNKLHIYKYARSCFSEMVAFIRLWSTHLSEEVIYKPRTCLDNCSKSYLESEIYMHFEMIICYNSGMDNDMLYSNYIRYYDR